jgi:CheY-like chemotaxis protein
MPPASTVLHVDDDPELLARSSSVLGSDGRFEVLTAASAGDGMELLSENRVDCVIGDSVRTPDGDLFVTVVAREYPDVPVILFTSTALPALADDLPSGSLPEYVRKTGPDDVRALLTHLSRLVEESPSLDVVPERTTDERTATDTDPAPSPVPDLGPAWTVVGLHDWDGPEELTASIVAALAGLTDTAVEDLPALYHEIDPEAVAGVVRPRSDGTPRHGVTVRFSYLGYDCLVTGGGAIAVRASSDGT